MTLVFPPRKHFLLSLATFVAVTEVALTLQVTNYKVLSLKYHFKEVKLCIVVHTIDCGNQLWHCQKAWSQPLNLTNIKNCLKFLQAKYILLKTYVKFKTQKFPIILLSSWSVFPLFSLQGRNTTKWCASYCRCLPSSTAATESWQLASGCSRKTYTVEISIWVISLLFV